MTSMLSQEFYHFLARYKFTLTFENSVCEDYITEKLWRPLMVGSVPVYMGSPSVRDWLPNNNSAILATDFESPRALAERLRSLNEDVAAYESHLAHKLSGSAEGKIANAFLASRLEERRWGVDNDHARGNFVDHFECLVCGELHAADPAASKVTRDHYDCPSPVSPLTGKKNASNWWTDVWESSRCEAAVLRGFVDLGAGGVDEERFFDELNRKVVKGDC